MEQVKPIDIMPKYKFGLPFALRNDINNGERTIDICCDPQKKLDVGTKVQTDTGYYLIDEIISENESKGNYDFLSFMPIVQKVKVSHTQP